MLSFSNKFQQKFLRNDFMPQYSLRTIRNEKLEVFRYLSSILLQIFHTQNLRKMSRRKQDKSGYGFSLIAGAIGVGLGFLSGYLFKKLFSDRAVQQRVSASVLQSKKKQENQQVFMASNVTNRDQNFEETILCPISLEMMSDPVTIPECGHSFDRKNIIPILNKKSQCPLCRKNTQIHRLVPNYHLKHVIDHYKQTRK